MQLKFFTIPAISQSEEERLLNNFLRANRVLETTTHFNPSPNGGTWNVCVKFLETSQVNKNAAKTKVDYKEVLSPEHFNVFSELRKIRKEIAANEAIPAFAVFTDEELAGVAQLNEITATSIKKVNGIGEKKAEKYGSKMVGMYNKVLKNETGQ